MGHPSLSTAMRWLWLVTVVVFANASAQGQINAWTNGSANWEDPHWSLGAPPRAGQSIYLTNQGWKAVNITSTNSSQSLTVSSINLWADSSSFNALLMNFSGFSKPLTTGVLNIGTNGAVTPLHATLNVTGAITIDGALNEGASAQVNAGSVTVGTITTVSSTFGQVGFYNQTNGTLQITGNLSVGGRGSFNQFDGAQTNGGIVLAGFDPQRTAFGIASFYLSNGVVSTPSITLDYATFTQAGGTNEVKGNLNVSSGSHLSTYNLNGGLLLASNTLVSYTPGVFIQSGGIHIVTNELRISQPDNGSGYIENEGQLTAANIQVDTGAAFHHNGGSVSNTGLLTLGGQGSAWFEGTGGQQMGKLALGNFSSTLSLPGIGCVLRFANSSGVVWSNQAMLTIEHWNGSRLGGGQHQILFGTSAAGLTAQKLSQIQFHNPGVTTGTFSAAILSTGEIVPAPLLLTSRFSNALVIQWGNGATLQTATNVGGPYADVVGATSPYTNQLADPKRFFRLRN
jgi:hypothetical protein